MAVPSATPTQYSGATAFIEFEIPTTEAKETDTLVPLVISGNGIDATGQAGLSATNFLFTNAAGTEVPSYLVNFTDGGDMQVWVRFPNVSTVSDQYVYLQYGAGITRSNSSTTFTGTGFDGFWPLDDSSSPAVDACGLRNLTEVGTPVYSQSAQVGDGVDVVRSSTEYFTGDNPAGVSFHASGWHEIKDNTSNFRGLFTWESDNGLACGLVWRGDLGGQFQINFDDQASSATATQNVFTASSYSGFPGDGIKHHFSIDYTDGGTPVLRIDGVNVALTGTGTFTIAVADTLYLGGYNAVLSAPADGLFDNWRIMADDVKSANWNLREYNNEDGFATDAIFTVSDTTAFGGITGTVDQTAEIAEQSATGTVVNPAGPITGTVDQTAEIAEQSATGTVVNPYTPPPPRWHGIESDTYGKILLDSGAIYKNFVSVGSPGTLLGATRGGAIFKRAPSYKELPYEGIPGQVVGQKHLTGVKVSLEVNIISLDEVNLALAIPNASVSAPSGDYVTITEQEWDAEAVHSLTNIAIIAQLSGESNPVVIVLDNPISEKDTSFSFKDKSEVVSKWAFSAFYKESVGFTSPPWRIYWPV